MAFIRNLSSAGRFKDREIVPMSFSESPAGAIADPVFVADSCVTWPDAVHLKVTNNSSGISSNVRCMIILFSLKTRRKRKNVTNIVMSCGCLIECGEPWDGWKSNVSTVVGVEAKLR